MKPSDYWEKTIKECVKLKTCEIQLLLIKNYMNKGLCYFMENKYPNINFLLNNKITTHPEDIKESYNSKYYIIRTLKIRLKKLKNYEREHI